MSSGWKKWECPPDALTIESKLKNLQLTERQEDEIAIAYYITEMNRATTAEEKQSWSDLLIKKRSSIIKKNLQEGMVADFQLWLQGRSKYNVLAIEETKYNPISRKYEKMNRECTPWGNKDLLHLPDVRKWLKLPVLNRDKVAKEIAALKMTTPLSLEQAWIYYKYIARGILVDGDILKEQRNFNDFDYMEKRPQMPVYDAEGNVTGFEPDMNYTPFSMYNPSMKKFDQQSYNANYSKFDRSLKAGNLHVLVDDADGFASFTPDDKLVLLLGAAEQAELTAPLLSGGNTVVLPSEGEGGFKIGVDPSIAYKNAELFNTLNTLFQKNTEQQSKQNETMNQNMGKFVNSLSDVLSGLKNVSLYMANIPDATVMESLIDRLSEQLKSKEIFDTGIVFNAVQTNNSHLWKVLEKLDETNTGISSLIKLHSMHPPPIVNNNTYNTYTEPVKTPILYTADDLGFEEIEEEEEELVQEIDKAPVAPAYESIAPIAVTNPDPVPITVNAAPEKLIFDLTAYPKLSHLFELEEKHHGTGLRKHVGGLFAHHLQAAAKLHLGNAEEMTTALENGKYEAFVKETEKDFLSKIENNRLTLATLFGAKHDNPDIYSYMIKNSLNFAHTPSIENKLIYLEKINAGLVLHDKLKHIEPKYTSGLGEILKEITNTVDASVFVRLHTDTETRLGLLQSGINGLETNIRSDKYMEYVNTIQKIANTGGEGYVLRTALESAMAAQTMTEEMAREILTGKEKKITELEGLFQATQSSKEALDALIKQKAEEHEGELARLYEQGKEHIRVRDESIEEYKKESAELTSQFEELMKFSTTLGEKTKQDEETIKLLKQDIDKFRESDQMNKEALQDLEKQINDMNNKLKESIREKEKLQNERTIEENRLKGEIDRYHKQNTGYVQQLQELETQRQAAMNSMGASQQQLFAQLAAKTQEVNTAKLAHEELQLKLNQILSMDVIKQVKELEGHKTTNQNKIDEMNKAIEQKNTSILEMERELMRLRDVHTKNQTLEEKLKEMELKSEKIKNERNTLQLQHDEAVKLRNQVVAESLDKGMHDDEYEERLKEANQNIEYYKTSLQTVTNAHNANMETITKLNDALQKAPREQDMNNLKKQIDERTKELSTIKSQNELLLKQRNEAIEANQGLLARLASANLSAGASEQLMKERDQLNTQLMQSTAELQLIKSKMSESALEAQRKISELEAKSREIHGKSERSQRKREQLEKTLKIGREEFEQTTEMARQMLDMLARLTEHNIQEEITTAKLFPSYDGRAKNETQIALLKAAEKINFLKKQIKRQREDIQKLANVGEQFREHAHELEERYVSSVKAFEAQISNNSDIATQRYNEQREFYEKTLNIALPVIQNDQNALVETWIRKRDILLEQSTRFTIAAAQLEPSQNMPAEFETEAKALKDLTALYSLELEQSKQVIQAERENIQTAMDQIQELMAEAGSTRNKETLDQTYHTLEIQQARLDTKTIQLDKISQDVDQASKTTEAVKLKSIGDLQKLLATRKHTFVSAHPGTRDAAISAARSFNNAVNQSLRTSPGIFYNMNNAMLDGFRSNAVYLRGKLLPHAQNNDADAINLIQHIDHFANYSQDILNMEHSRRSALGFQKAGDSAHMENSERDFEEANMEDFSDEEIDDDLKGEGEEFYRFNSREEELQQINLTRQIFAKLASTGNITPEEQRQINIHYETYGISDQLVKQAAYDRNVQEAAIAKQYKDVFEMMRDPGRLIEEINQVGRQMEEQQRHQPLDQQIKGKTRDLKEIRSVLRDINTVIAANNGSSEIQKSQAVMDKLSKEHPEILNTMLRSIAFKEPQTREGRKVVDEDVIKSIYVSRLINNQKIESQKETLDYLSSQLTGTSGYISDEDARMTNQVFKGIDDAIGENALRRANLNDPMVFLINHGEVENEIALKRDNREKYGIAADVYDLLIENVDAKAKQDTSYYMRALTSGKTKWTGIGMFGQFSNVVGGIKRSLTLKLNAEKIGLNEHTTEIRQFYSNVKAYTDIANVMAANSYGEEGDNTEKAEKTYTNIMEGVFYDFKRAVEDIGQIKNQKERKAEKEILESNRYARLQKGVSDIIVKLQKEKQSLQDQSARIERARQKVEAHRAQGQRVA